jgi:hypothetical protein
MTVKTWADYPAVERVPLSFRVPPAIKAKLERMARWSGRSLAGEVERLLEIGIIADSLISAAIDTE